jgi:hypothetical protein
MCFENYSRSKSQSFMDITNTTLKTSENLCKHVSGFFMSYFLSPKAIDGQVNYYLSFTDQGKQISIFCFRLQQTNGSLPFLFSVCRKNKQLMTFPLVPFSVCEIPETWRHGHRVMETWRHIHGDMETWRNRDMET